MKWPEPRVGIPEGHYSFRVNKEPELKKIQTKNGESRSLLLYVVGLGPNGDHYHSESFVPWDPRYADLCEALGVEHGRDIEVTGKVFEADIVYEASEKEPDKSYARMKNIRPSDGVKVGDEDGDIPF